MADEEHDGASPKELLVEACRRNNTDLLAEVLEGRPDADITKLLNETTTVMGNHLYHEAASRGNYEIIDLLLDQPDFECDPVSRLEGDTPLHTAVRWLNAEGPAQRPFGAALVSMMLEAGSNPRVKNRARLTPLQLVDPSNPELRRLIEDHQFASQNAGDYVNVEPDAQKPGKATAKKQQQQQQQQPQQEESDDDAEFSGSDEEERAEWERRKREKRRR